MEMVDGGGEIGRPELGPHPRQEEKLGVCAFPEEEIAETLLAARAYQEIYVRGAAASVRGAEACGKRFTVEDGGSTAAMLSAQNHVARGVIHGQAQVKPPGAPGDDLRAGGRLTQAARKPVEAPDERQADSLSRQRGGPALEKRAQQRHKPGDLCVRALPVVGREGEEGERADAEPRRRVDNASCGTDAAAVAGQSRQPARGRPPPVAVHDDADVEPKGTSLCRSTLHSEVKPPKKITGRACPASRGSAPSCD